MKKPSPKSGRPRGYRRNAFSKWVDASGLTYDQLGAKLGCSKQRIANLRSGSQRPGLDLANRIAALTKGAVPTDTWK